MASGASTPHSLERQVARLLSEIVRRRGTILATRALLVGISGIDASGKGYHAARIAQSLGEQNLNVALIGADGWLNLPHVRFNDERPAEHFYNYAFRFDEMFETLILPLKQNREIDLQMDYTDETATSYRGYHYCHRDIDVIVLEGIFLLKLGYRQHLDLACWVECSFETALARAIGRCQECLSPAETKRVFETIYFPAQRIHLARDNPRAAAEIVILNDLAIHEDESAAAFNLP